jgi:hypothetical protein
MQWEWQLIFTPIPPHLWTDASQNELGFAVPQAPFHYDEHHLVTLAYRSIV